MWKKIVFGLMTIFLGITLLSGCRVDLNNMGGKVRVVSTIFPFSDMAKRLGGEYVESNVLVPAGSSPHTYEPTVSDVEKLNNADVVLVVGAGMDDWVRKMMIDSGIDEDKIVDLSKFVTLRNFNEGEEGQSVDPHYWVSPKRVLEFLDDITAKYKEVDGDNAVAYDGRLKNYTEEMTQLDAEIREVVAGYSRKEIVTLHDAFGYFADDYGLTIAGVIEPISGSEPTAQQIEELENKIRELNVPAVYGEPQLSTKIVDSLQNDLQIKVGTLDPLGGVEARLSYVGTVKFNLTELKRNLQ